MLPGSALPYGRASVSGTCSILNVYLTQRRDRKGARCRKACKTLCPATIVPYMKRVITAQDVPLSGELRVPVGTIVTASAHEVAAGRGVRIVELPEDQLTA